MSSSAPRRARPAPPAPTSARAVDDCALAARTGFAINPAAERTRRWFRERASRARPRVARERAGAACEPEGSLIRSLSQSTEGDTTMSMSVVELQRALRALRLSGMIATLEARAQQVTTHEMDFLEAFSWLVQDELDRRRSRLLDRRFTLSG